ncbi:MAG: hypothetical protein ABFE08_17425 [Armatimonadia bacterium]
MIAERSLQLLLARTSTTGAGVVGEGAGATAALALGMMVPNQCRFICAYQPRALPGPACFDPTRLAQGVRTPTLVGLGAHSKAESSEIVMRIYEQLTCDKELAQLPKARRGAGSELKAWQDMWHEWVSDTIDVQ